MLCYYLPVEREVNRARHKVRRLPKERENEIEKAIEEIVGGAGEKILAKLFPPEEGVQTLLLARTRAIKIGKYPISPLLPATVSASFVSDEFHDSIAAESNKSGGDPIKMVVAHDVAHGASLVISSVMFAAEGIKMGHQAFMKEFARQSGLLGLKADRKLLAQLDAEQRRKEKLLLEDPTGFTLIDEAVKQANRQPNRIVEGPMVIVPQLDQRLVSLGAEKVRTFYRPIYGAVASLETTLSQNHSDLSA